MIDFAYGMASGIIPTKFDIQKELGRERTDEKDNTRVEVTKWLDSNHVLVEFSWPGDEWEPSVQGWLIFDLSAYAIKAITASGCDRNSGEAEEPMTDSGEQSDIIVEIDPPIIHLGDLSEPLSLRIKNLSEEEYRGGYHYNLEIYDNGEWKEVPLMLNQIFNDIGLIIEPGGEVVWPLNLMRYERDNFDFVPGRYRVVYDKWHGEFMIGFISE
ncbi:MAG: hypothetical protein LBI19_09240 [Oscillospiraceae bacterium]|jgi:hypothetical protein|nr:hypothetical protein [Oscillospiraceae bacterium]